MTKWEAVELAKKFNWTAADAKRAFVDLDLNTANEQDLLMALANFAGQELLNRQRLQAAQKAQVTIKKNEIKQIEAEYQQHMEQSKQTIEEMQSLFIPVIAKLYGFSKQFGLQDPWIEAMLETYEQHHPKAS
ncbi:hypothetical protein [Crocosphaera watsonii]|uniref:Uncharacterized protein n=2 Tax=Crocosphaera watsonii TaxID=263511 RepID=G5JDR2_CROWT|nr:hypothetical protein [Crocosphaera watsonii]EHJ09669.1 hypothetical protein CWATWH0003_5553 [Crocosphaera watsonii WH 0003]CCQ55683.1 hypothetical protein CWATWH0005_3775 [Crocosphaera watsonii WH 0005]